jgi:hypothetical protein
MNHSNSDPGIPVLTEIISPPAVGTAADNVPPASPTPPAPLVAPAVREAVIAPPIPAPATGAVDEQMLRDLERDINDRVLQQLLTRIDFVLEQRIRDSLADVLQTAVTGLAAEIRQGLQHTLEDAIAHAVSREITRLLNTKN